MPAARRAKGTKAKVTTHTEDSNRALGADFLPCLAALSSLRQRLQSVSVEELAMWVFDGPESGGLAAYVSANELSPPPRFSFQMLQFSLTECDPDFVAPLMACWFLRTEIRDFQPAKRYIKGDALRARWSADRDVSVEAFVLSKIAESRLHGGHPIFGLTQGTLCDSELVPGWESAMFDLAEVEAIEATDLAGRGLGRPIEEGPAERRARIQRRADQLRAQNVRSINAKIAKEEGVSVSRIKQLRAPVEPKPQAANLTGALGSPVQEARKR